MAFGANALVVYAISVEFRLSWFWAVACMFLPLLGLGFFWGSVLAVLGLWSNC